MLQQHIYFKALRVKLEQLKKIQKQLERRVNKPAECDECRGVGGTNLNVNTASETDVFLCLFVAQQHQQLTYTTLNLQPCFQHLCIITVLVYYQ